LRLLVFVQGIVYRFRLLPFGMPAALRFAARQYAAPAIRFPFAPPPPLRAIERNVLADMMLPGLARLRNFRTFALTFPMLLTSSKV